MGRRSKTVSTVVRAGSPYWYYKLKGWTTYRASDIRILYTRDGKPKNQSEAEQWALARAPLHITDPGITLSKYQERFYTADCPHCARLEDDGRPITEKWRGEQRRRLDLIAADPIMRRPIAEVTPGELDDLKQRLKRLRVAERPISLAMVNRIVGTLKTVFKEAHHRRDIVYDPTVGVGRIRTEGRELGIFTLDEFRELLNPQAWSRPKNIGQEESYPAVAPYAYAFLAATTGARPDSILNLHWKDIVDGWIAFEKVKTRRPYRIPILDQTAALLERLREESLHTDQRDLVLCHDAGTPFGMTWVRKRWIRAMKAAGLSFNDELGRRRTPYRLKHTLITLLLNAGADELLVREYVGHSHGHGATRILSATQRHYYGGAGDKLNVITQMVGGLLFESAIRTD